LAGGVDDMFAEVVAPAFFRRERRLRAHSYLLGLVSELEHKNAWTRAEFARDATGAGAEVPDQREAWLLSRRPLRHPWLRLGESRC
jgi:hypothetical protein